MVRYYNREMPLFTEPLLTELRNHELCWQPINLVELSEYTHVYKMVWENFTQKADVQLDYLLFDGSLLHHPINDMMRNYNILLEQAASHVNSLIDVVNPLHPLVIYLSSNNVAERLQKAHVCRNQAPPPAEQIKFWEERKQMDLAVLQQLPIPCDCYDISTNNWEFILDLVAKRILETDEERRARIYPIVLSEYNTAWPEWYAEEKANLERLIGGNIVRIRHIGSTAVPGLLAKPTVDILLEVPVGIDFDKVVAAFFPYREYICLYPPTNPEPLCVLKGYTTLGFAEKVFHIHVRETGDYDEPVFRDYLIVHPEAAAEYTELKRRLFQSYEYDRDGYTEAKCAFVKTIIEKAKNYLR